LIKNLAGKLSFQNLVASKSQEQFISRRFKISWARKTRYIVMTEVRYMRREKYGIEAGETAAGNAEPTVENSYTKPFTIRKCIGATSYEVAVYFSRKSRESFEEKIIRLVRNEALNGGTNR
jgi:hypothetical protein